MIAFAELEISIYLNIMAVVTMLGFLIISRRMRQRVTVGDRIFFIMCINVLLYAVLSLSAILVPADTPEQYYWKAMIFKTLIELVVLFTIYQWLLFVGYGVHESKDHLRRRYWIFLFPMAILVVLFIVNLFTEILFTYDENHVFRPKPLFTLVVVVELVYFVISGVLIWWNNRRVDRMERFHFAPILIPFATGLFETFVSEIAIGPIGFTAAIIFIFFSMTERWQYDDEIPGFYHRAILDYMREQVKTGRADYYCVILFKSEGNEEALADLIRAELPKRGKAVHLSEGVFAAYLGKGKEDLRDLIVLAVTESAEEYDKAHPDRPIALTTEVINRKKDEDVEVLLECAV